MARNRWIREMTEVKVSIRGRNIMRGPGIFVTAWEKKKIRGGLHALGARILCHLDDFYDQNHRYSVMGVSLRPTLVTILCFLLPLLFGKGAPCATKIGESGLAPFSVAPAIAHRPIEPSSRPALRTSALSLVHARPGTAPGLYARDSSPAPVALHQESSGWDG